MTTPLVNITMVAYNRCALTRAAVESVLANTDYPYCLTIVDNNSSDDTAEYLESLHSEKVRILRLHRNMGVAVAANLGWALGRTPYYVKIDNDIEIADPSWLHALVQTAEADRRIYQVGHRVLDRIEVEKKILSDGRTFYSSAICNGACVLVPRKVHEVFGFWNEDYGLYGFEDLDYSSRCISKGGLVGYVSLNGSVLHRGYDNVEYVSREYEDSKQQNIHSRRFGENIYVLNRLLFDNGARKIFCDRKYLPSFSPDGKITFSTNPKYAHITKILNEYCEKIAYEGTEKNIAVDVSRLKS